MKVYLSNYSSMENPIVTIYKAYRLCYSKGEQCEIALPTLNNGDLDYEKMGKFISNLMKLGHTTPLEHVSFTFELSGVSRALTHQLVRHRTGKFNQQSQRYCKLGQFEYVIPPRIAEDLELKNRYIQEMNRDQDAYDFLTMGLLRNALNKDGHLQPSETLEMFKERDKATYLKYEKIAIEDARYVFPNACCSNITVTMDLNNFRKFYSLRNCKHSQWEIQELAKEMGKEVRKIIPFALQGAINCGVTCFECVPKEEK